MDVLLGETIANRAVNASEIGGTKSNFGLTTRSGAGLRQIAPANTEPAAIADS